MSLATLIININSHTLLPHRCHYPHFVTNNNSHTLLPHRCHYPRFITNNNSHTLLPHRWHYPHFITNNNSHIDVISHTLLPTYNITNISPTYHQHITKKQNLAPRCGQRIVAPNHYPL